MKHPLKIAGEVQMKKVQHDMTMLRRRNERMLAMLKRLESELGHSPAFNKWDLGPAPVLRDLRAILSELGEAS